MSTFADVIPVMARQPAERQILLGELRGFFYSASLNGIRLTTGQPANADMVRQHMHERADYLHEGNRIAVAPMLSSLMYSFGRAGIPHEQQRELIDVARGAMNEVINRRINNGTAWTDSTTFRDESSAEAVLAAARHLGWN